MGGGIGKIHSLMLLTKQLLEFQTGTNLIVTVEQGSDFANYALGRFRLSMTNDARVDEWVRTPSTVISPLIVAVGDRTTAQQELIAQHFRSIAPELTSPRLRLASLQKSLGDLKPESEPIMRELAVNRRITKLQHRGNFEDVSQDVVEGIPIPKSVSQ